MAQTALMHPGAAALGLLFNIAVVTACGVWSLLSGFDAMTNALGIGGARVAFGPGRGALFWFGLAVIFLAFAVGQVLLAFSRIEVSGSTLRVRRWGRWSAIPWKSIRVAQLDDSGMTKWVWWDWLVLTVEGRRDVRVPYNLFSKATRRKLIGAVFEHAQIREVRLPPRGWIRRRSVTFTPMELHSGTLPGRGLWSWSYRVR